MRKFTVLVVSLLIFSNLTNAQVRGRINTDRINTERAVGAVVQGVQSFTITDAQVIQHTNEFMEWMDDNNPLCRIDDADAGKRAVAQRLANIASAVPQELIDRYNLDIQAYFVRDVNAFAAANGAIRIFAGLMEVMNDDEILAVIGHEIGHIANQDSKDRFVRALRVSAFRDAVGAVDGGRLSDSQLGELSVALANAQYSQSQEFEADAYGFDFMRKIGRDPNAMASALGVLLRMQQEAGSAGNSRFASLFSSHPDLERRIERLNARR